MQHDSVKLFMTKASSRVLLPYNFYLLCPSILRAGPFDKLENIILISRSDYDLQDFTSEVQKVFGKEGEKLKDVKLTVSVHRYSVCGLLCNLFVMMFCSYSSSL